MKEKGAGMILHQIEKDKRVVQNDTKAPAFLPPLAFSILPLPGSHRSRGKGTSLLTGEEG